MTIGGPFAVMTSYGVFASLAWWPLAVVSVMTLCFITYGSSSHDLVHQTLGLQRGWNHFWLSLIELFSLRSGTAYRLSHLHHHQHPLESTDLEDSAAQMTLIQTLLCGPMLQVRLWIWAWLNHPRQRSLLLLDPYFLRLEIVPNANSRIADCFALLFMLRDSARAFGEYSRGTRTCGAILAWPSQECTNAIAVKKVRKNRNLFRRTLNSCAMSIGALGSLK